MTKLFVQIEKFDVLGNDFILIDKSVLPKYITIDSEVAKRLCDRHSSVGADGLIILQDHRVDRPNCTVRMRLFNNDGSKAEISGNGLRAIGHWAFLKAKLLDNEISCVYVDCDGFDTRTVSLVDVTGAPGFLRSKVSFPEAREIQIPSEVLDLMGIRAQVIKGFDLMNPHLTVFLGKEKSMSKEEMQALATSFSPLFANGINTEFFWGERDLYEMVVYERGVGETRSCGSGTVAIANCVKRYVDKTLESIYIRNPGGELVVHLGPDGDWLEGPSRYVCQASICLGS